jgi:hypothetical protein
VTSRHVWQQCHGDVCSCVSMGLPLLFGSFLLEVGKYSEFLFVLL